MGPKMVAGQSWPDGSLWGLGLSRKMHNAAFVTSGFPVTRPESGPPPPQS